MKNNRKKKQINPGMMNRRIDIDSIYRKMSSVINERLRLQEEQKQLWNVIKRYNCNRSTEMNKCDVKIGNKTHELNKLINELCKFKKTHKAMNLAYNYLTKEIDRIKKIINSKKELIAQVQCGYTNLISSYGVTHSDPSGLQNYVNIKLEQLNKLEKWKMTVSRYRV